MNEVYKPKNFNIDDYDIEKPKYNRFLCYRFWKINISSLLDASIIEEIFENGVNEDEIITKLGITKKEFINPDPEIIEKVKEFLYPKEKKYSYIAF